MLTLSYSFSHQDTFSFSHSGITPKWMWPYSS